MVRERDAKKLFFTRKTSNLFLENYKIKLVVEKNINLVNNTLSM